MDSGTIVSWIASNERFVYIDGDDPILEELELVDIQSADMMAFSEMTRYRTLSEPIQKFLLIRLERFQEFMANRDQKTALA